MFSLLNHLYNDYDYFILNKSHIVRTNRIVDIGYTNTKHLRDDTFWLGMVP